ncbi:hypothetical protein BIWAKO_04155 [Bosea sp. BIWAKO-01]|nr:hypothetical protein BIWAKO_04155 [Bosea sp. BIWAKO-01]
MRLKGRKQLGEIASLEHPPEFASGASGVQGKLRPQANALQANGDPAEAERRGRAVPVLTQVS